MCRNKQRWLTDWHPHNPSLQWSIFFKKSHPCTQKTSIINRIQSDLVGFPASVGEMRVSMQRKSFPSPFCSLSLSVLGVEGQKRGKLSKMADARQQGTTPADSAHGWGSGNVSNLVIHKLPAIVTRIMTANLNRWWTILRITLIKSIFFSKQRT